ncbi:hypothetical protein Slin15195_G124390 [Septoria linicola]|uniref:Zn(2)-C6 fungal-type domain-containing protein n=1 Tax=Septoria linicola TaxID=215465 RepID=A0A9Q9B1V5_9PEZI|nr:hypothetical protein Slin14017_G080600 [Septoria linicola]USW59120.1 hypothetical protein Slin15195_G124390 [Septoria linicola]
MTDNWMYAPVNAAAGNQTSPSEARISADGANTSFSAIQAATYRDSTSPTESSHKTAGTAPTKIRRRNRQITSCLECRRRKLKCDKQAPCVNCTRFRRDCLYLAPAMDPQAQQKLAEIKEKMGMLEKNLEREVASQSQKGHLGGGKVTKLTAEEAKAQEQDDEDEVNEDEDNLEPTPLATQDNVYEDNNDDELMDLGVQMGKMRISERIGGWIRPKLVDEITDTLEDVKAGKSRFSETPLAIDHRELSPGAGQKIQATPKSFIGPGPDYIAPASSFFFPGTSMSTSLIDYLPSKNAADQLVAQYWHAVHYMCKIVHRPTFEQQYAIFWSQIITGSEPVPSNQAIVFAAMFSAAVSMTNEQAMQKFGTSKNALVDSLRSGTEFALAKANFLRTTKVDTMQAFVMYLIPLVRAEVSRAHSALVGTAIRLAECMGLHRDGTHYQMTPVEVQVRRMIWHQLCFLDMRTCEATGPRPQIRAEDYDTKMPWNVNDADLIGDNPTTEDRDYWTDTTFERIRAECQEMRRKVWYDIVAIDKKKKSLTSVLVKVQKFMLATKERYLPMLDLTSPVQRLTGLMLETMTKGLHLQVLHRYLFSTTQRMPDRLRQVLIEAGLTQMECSVEWESTTELLPWVWYRGAFNQYHAALLLLVEVYAYPMRKEAARIWKCLDYIFEIPSHLAPKQKAELVLTDLRDRMETFHQMRKLKVSNQMQQRVGGGSKSQYRTPSAVSSDAIGHMQQQKDAAMGLTPQPLPPAQFSPPPPQLDSQSSSGGSRQGSIAGREQQNQPQQNADVEMQMQDIDWAELEKVFAPDVYTGDLNLPNFNMTDFTGSGFAGPALDPYTFNAVAASNINDITNSNFVSPGADASFGRPSAGSFSTPGEGFPAMNVADMADVNFGGGPTLLPALSWQKQQERHQQRQREKAAFGSSEGGYQ